MRAAAPIPGFRSETARVGNVRLHHWLGGDPNGQPVLLWHGFLSIGVPVVPLGGTNGLGAKVGEMVGLVAGSVDAATLADGGHFLPKERPDEVVRRVLDMAAKVRTAQAGAASRGGVER